MRASTGIGASRVDLSERVGTLWVGSQPGMRCGGIADLSADQAVPDGHVACLEELRWQDFGESYRAMLVD